MPERTIAVVGEDRRQAAAPPAQAAPRRPGGGPARAPPPARLTVWPVPAPHRAVRGYGVRTEALGEEALPPCPSLSHDPVRAPPRPSL